MELKSLEELRVDLRKKYFESHKEEINDLEKDALMIKKLFEERQKEKQQKENGNN